MPVSGRPTKAALLKITQGSSTREVKGFQKAPREAGAWGAVEVAVVGSDGLRFHSTAPNTTSDVIRPAESKMTAIPIRETVSTTSIRDCGAVEDSGWVESTASGCGGSSTGLGSKIR